jgi:hypothetical protein
MARTAARKRTMLENVVEEVGRKRKSEAQVDPVYAKTSRSLLRHTPAGRSEWGLSGKDHEM